MIPVTPADRERARVARTRSGSRLQIVFLVFFGLLVLTALLAPAFTVDRALLVSTWWALAAAAMMAFAIQILAALRLRALTSSSTQDEGRTARPSRPIDFDRAWRDERS